MLRSPRIRTFVIGAIPLAGYAAIYREALDRHLQNNGMLFFGTVATVILITGGALGPRKLSALISWGILSPVLASAIGYAAIILNSYLRHGEIGPDMSLGSWVLIAFTFPYFVCSAWTLSVALPLLGIASVFLLPTATTSSPDNTAPTD